MSGIAGIIYFDGRHADSEAIATMTNAMAYRGPDGISHRLGVGAAFGHCMMRTTAEAIGETQPFVEVESGFVITFAGRLDRRNALIAALRAGSCVVREHFDAALVLYAFIAFGYKCMQHLEGDFAFSIWDPVNRRLFLCRDRLGLTPIHYWKSCNAFAFASDPHALLRLPFVPKRLNEGVMAEIISDRWLLGEDTLWQGISTVRPGAYVVVDSSGLRQERYWPSLIALPSMPQSDEEYVHTYRELLFDEVENSCRANTPVTFSVSGGLDSSALICAAEHMRKSMRLSGTVTLPCTLNYSGLGDVDDIEYARLACSTAGRPLFEIYPEPWPASDLLDHCRDLMTLPGYLNGRMHLHVMRYAQSQGSRVLVTGEGGDQLIGGQRSYQFELLRSKQWRRFVADAASELSENSLHAILPMLSVASSAFLPSRVTAALRRAAKRLFRATQPCESSPLLSSKARQLLMERSARRDELDNTSFQWWPSRNEFFTNILTIFEQLAARQQVEVRHPYMSAPLVELSAITPNHLKEADGVEKIMHREAMRSVLPASIRMRIDKSGCESAVDRQLEGLLLGFRPSSALPIADDGYRELCDRFWRQRRAEMPSVGNDSWTLTSIFYLHTLASLVDR